MTAVEPDQPSLRRSNEAQDDHERVVSAIGGTGCRPLDMSWHLPKSGYGLLMALRTNAHACVRCRLFYRYR